MSFERFHAAQAHRWAGYETALAEIRGGGKTSHWIWYIFPQIEGLGHSSTAREYALRDLDDACAYLRDPLLQARYEEIARAIGEHLAQGRSLEELMGGRTDALKLVSSLTLMHAAARHLAKQNPAFASLTQLSAVLLQQTAAQGYPACTFTLARIT